MNLVTEYIQTIKIMIQYRKEGNEEMEFSVLDKLDFIWSKLTQDEINYIESINFD